MTNNPFPTALMLLLAFILAGPSAVGQVRQAEKEMALYNYTDAVSLLKRALKREDTSETGKITRMLAECYRKMNDWTNARVWYLRAIESGDDDATDYFYLGQAYRNTGKYQEAKQLFRICDSLYPANPAVGNMIAACDSAISWLGRKPSVEVGNMRQLNSPQSEFGCIRIPAGIVFTSDRITDHTPEKRYGWTGNEYLTLYLAEPSHPWSDESKEGASGISRTSINPPTRFPDLAGQAWHNGPASFDSSFSNAAVNRTFQYGDKGRRDPGQTRTHLLKIYTSVRIENRWCKPGPFFLNSQEYSVGHPALSPDGTTLYFVSDRPGGYGGTDIYFCTRTEECWGSPVNLGPVVNSPGNEVFPFVTGTGTLWFASDYHPGFGGQDLFLTSLTNGVWSPPGNPGYPLNSAFDDFSVWTDAAGEEGLFSSNRPGGMGEDDIYWFRKVRKSGDPLAVGSRQWADSTLTTAPLHHDTMEFSPVHGYELNKPYLLRNIYYDFNKWDIREDAKPSLDSLVRIMERYPVKVELGSHTDCRGTEAYNLELSGKRAESAVAYIISRGIDPGRIVARGYGKTVLVNPCNCQDTPCPEALHQENRRTEFRILGVIR